MHRGRHRDLRKCRAPVDSMEPSADLVPHCFEPSRRHVTGVVGVEHQLNTAALVLAVQLRIAVVVANESSATNTRYRKHRAVAPRRVVREVASLTRSIAGAEQLVVSVGEFATVADDVEAVVRPMWHGESVR